MHFISVFSVLSGKRVVQKGMGNSAELILQIFDQIIENCMDTYTHIRNLNHVQEATCEFIDDNACTICRQYVRRFDRQKKP